MVTFCVFGVFSVVCFELSVPVQVIAWKDSSPKWPIMCRAERWTLLTHLLLLHYQHDYSPRGCKAEVFTDWMPFRSLDQRRQSTALLYRLPEGDTGEYSIVWVEKIPLIMPNILHWMRHFRDKCYTRSDCTRYNGHNLVAGGKSNLRVYGLCQV